MQLLSLLHLLFGGLASAALIETSLVFTVGQGAPDGTNRQIYLVNGTTPGPTITGTVGDTLVVTVINNLDVETTLHWHGITQKGTIWSDGVPGVVQRMIDPGVSFVYNMTFDEPGHYWYHAHSRAIYGDGIRGNIFVNPTDADLKNGPWSKISSSQSDINAMIAAYKKPHPLAIIDWTHYTSEEAISEWNDNRVEPLCIDSVLINGKGRQICPPASTFAPLLNDVVPAVTARGCAFPNNTFVQPFSDAEPDKVDPSFFFTCTNSTSPMEVIQVSAADGWASINIIGMTALWDFAVSIDDHPMWVYAADGQFHTPQLVDVVNVPPGERFSAMIQLNKPAGDYTIRVSATITPQFISGYGVLSYNPTASSSTTLPAAKNQAMDYGGNPLPGFKELDPLTLTPFPAIPPPTTATQTFIFEMFRLTSLTWAMNQDPFGAFLELAEPLLFEPNQKIGANLVASYPVGSIVDVVIQLNPGNPKHPLHKHGVKFWIIGQGSGTFSWKSIADAQKASPSSFNLVNPPYRDGLHTPDSVPSANWIAIRYVVNEPGTVFFHCHINLHTVGGMAIALLEGMNVTDPVNIPQYYIDFDQAAAKSQGRKRAPRAHEDWIPFNVRQLE